MTIPLGNGSSPRWNWISAVLLIFLFAIMGYWVNANDKKIDDLTAWKNRHVELTAEFQTRLATDLAQIKAQLTFIQAQLEELKEQNKRLTQPH